MQRLEVVAHGLQECRIERLWREVREPGEDGGDPLLHRLGGRASGCKVEQRRFDDHERAGRTGPASGGDQARDRTVRVADQVGAVAEQFGDIVRVAVEVLAAGRWAVAVSAPVDEEQAVAVGERPLRGPGQTAPREAAVDEEHGLPVAPRRDVQLAHRPRGTIRWRRMPPTPGLPPKGASGTLWRPPRAGRSTGGP